MPLTVMCSHCGVTNFVEAPQPRQKSQCSGCGRPLSVPLHREGDAEEFSESGQPIYRHQSRASGFELATGDSENIEAISNHIEQHVGKVDFVYHEILSDLVHIDVHVVKPTEERPFHTLITSGMSDRPMTVPEGAEELRFAELLVSLPPDWPLGEEDFQDEKNYWPIRTLKILARLPHEYDTWLGFGPTIPRGDPPEPFADNTQLCGSVILPPIQFPEEFHELVLSEDKTVHFYAVVPLYREELEFKLKHGVEKLLGRFGKHDIGPVLDVRRPNVCRR